MQSEIDQETVHVLCSSSFWYSSMELATARGLPSNTKNMYLFIALCNQLVKPKCLKNSKATARVVQLTTNKQEGRADILWHSHCRGRGYLTPASASLLRLVSCHGPWWVVSIGCEGIGGKLGNNVGNPAQPHRSMKVILEMNTFRHTLPPYTDAHTHEEGKAKHAGSTRCNVSILPNSFLGYRHLRTKGYTNHLCLRIWLKMMYNTEAEGAKDTVLYTP